MVDISLGQVKRLPEKSFKVPVPEGPHVTLLQLFYEPIKHTTRFI